MNIKYKIYTNYTRSNTIGQGVSKNGTIFPEKTRKRSHFHPNIDQFACNSGPKICRVWHQQEWIYQPVYSLCAEAHGRRIKELAIYRWRVLLSFVHVLQRKENTLVDKFIPADVKRGRFLVHCCKQIGRYSDGNDFFFLFFREKSFHFCSPLDQLYLNAYNSYIFYI